MPTNNSYPLNCTNNTTAKIRSGTHWKNFTNDTTSSSILGPEIYPVKYNIVGMSKYNPSPPSQDANEFRARPLKHWRLQYKDTNNVSGSSKLRDQSYFNRKYLIGQMERPGSTIVKASVSTESDCDKCNIGPHGLMSPLLGKVNNVGINNKHSAMYSNNTSQSSCIKKCVPICDPPSKAKKRVQYPSRLSKGGLCEKPYYQSNLNYLKSRCKKEIINQNNSQYAQQGAVSSSSRLLRLKLNTINTNANSVGDSYGKSAYHALAYSGRPDAPFVNKQKMNAGGYAKKCDTNLYHLYKPGGGNPTTSALNTINNERTIGHYNPGSEYPGSNSNFIFMS